MSNEIKKGAVPRLRFPEFEEAGEWEYDLLGNVCSSFSGGTPPTSKPEYYSGNIPFIRSAEIDKTSTELFLSDEGLKNSAAKLVEEGDVLVALYGANSGEVALSKQRGAINQAILCLRSKESNAFIYHFLSHRKDWIVRKYIQGGQGNLSGEIVKAIEVPFPKPAEQQKIAACLSSLDELIAAEVEAGEALKAHKRGLMQGLFPREGETVPRVRFAGFEGEWVEEPLGKSLVSHPEYGIGAPAVPFSESLPTYLRITDISEDGKFISSQKVSVGREVTEDNYLNEGDIVLARTGASVGKSYKYRANDGRLVFAGFLIRVRPDEKKLDSEFLFQFLSTSQYWRWVAFTSTRSGQPGINGNEYSSMPLPLPPTLEEQQKIADTLSSLDELIAAQAQKIEALKEHKRGLMQGLFV